MLTIDSWQFPRAAEAFCRSSCGAELTVELDGDIAADGGDCPALPAIPRAVIMELYRRHEIEIAARAEALAL